MSPVVRGVLAGAAAGAAGTTALNITTYLDMVVRGRGASSTPEESVKRLAAVAHVPIPGDDSTRENRVEGLGALLGLVTGTAIGAGVGAVRGLGVRLPAVPAALATALGAMVAANGPMTALKVTDPRTWSVSDWASDVVPHLVYGTVTSATLRGLLSK
jgi:ribose/xylose/arabinose/galactoside ABC-type transport system permease subunit